MYKTPLIKKIKYKPNGKVWGTRWPELRCVSMTGAAFPQGSWRVPQSRSFFLSYIFADFALCLTFWHDHIRSIRSLKNIFVFNSNLPLKRRLLFLFVDFACMLYCESFGSTPLFVTPQFQSGSWIVGRCEVYGTSKWRPQILSPSSPDWMMGWVRIQGRSALILPTETAQQWCSFHVLSCFHVAPFSLLNYGEPLGSMLIERFS